MPSTTLSDGWVRHEYSERSRIRVDYWRTPFAPERSDEEWVEVSRSPGDLRESPIRAYDANGIGPVEWVNALHDCAVILAADGTWKTGGEFHVWYSAGGGSVPREITKSVISGPRVVAGENVEWCDQLAEAIAQVERYVGVASVSGVEN